MTMTIPPPPPMPPKAERRKLTNPELKAILHNIGLAPRACGGTFMARCPVHDDRTPSMSACVTEEGTLLLHCFAGCQFVHILDALGLRGAGYAQPNVTAIRRDEPVGPHPEMLQHWRELQSRGRPEDTAWWEAHLGIPAGGLAALGAVWSLTEDVLACPMWNRLAGDVIGVRVRSPDGRKFATLHSHNGIFAPLAFPSESPRVYLPEGMTDTAVALGMGVNALGRPSTLGGRPLIRAAVKISGREAVVIEDNDEPNKNGERPGEVGAATLANELALDGVRTVRIRPPNGIKDLRAWYAAGLDRQELEYTASMRPPVIGKKP